MTHISLVEEHISSLSDEQLAEGITTWSGRIASGEAKLLELVAEFDRREAWAGAGLLSCAHWLVWKTGLSPGAAREKVRVARALVQLPLVAAALGAAAMSYSQVRAVTRVAVPEDQERWVDICRHSTAAQLERVVRGIHRVRRSEQDAADPELARWRTQVSSSYDEDGNRRIVVLVPAEQAVMFDAALAQIQADLDAHAAAEPTAGDVSAGTPPVSADVSAGTPRTLRATLGDALIEMARRALEQASPARTRQSKAALSVHVDPLSGWARLADGEFLPPTSSPGETSEHTGATRHSVASLAHALRGLPGRGGPPRLRPLTTADLTRADLGRTARLPNQALRDQLATIDGERCRFPGCTRRHRLHAHHVEHWSAGGRTDLANLVLLCSRHHTVVHQHGFELRLTEDRELLVSTSDGIRLLHHPALPYGNADELDPDHRVSAETLPPDTVEPRMDLGYCVSVLLQQAA